MSLMRLDGLEVLSRYKINGTDLNRDFPDQIRDSCNTLINGADNPIEGATIRIAGNTHTTSTDKFGDYYRLLLPGPYNITASIASPYDSTTINDAQSTTIPEEKQRALAKLISLLPPVFEVTPIKTTF